jgi:23S rRNA (uracil1939-C5)-methyltransferase
VTIDGLAPGGEGVGRAAGRTVFAACCAPGDVAEVEVPPGEGPAHGTLVRLLSPGESRVPAPCRHFGPEETGEGAPPGAGQERGCGGCEWLCVRYPAQLAAKERGLRERLRRLGGLEPGSYREHPIVPSPEVLRYRSRAKFHLDRASGRLAFFRRRSHHPVPLRECHLLEPELDALRESVGPALVAARLEPREVALEWSDHQERGAAWLRLAALGPAAGERAEELLRRLPALAGLVLEAEGAPPLLVGEPVLLHRRSPGEPGAGLARSRPDVFRQANRGANALLVRTALDLLRPDGEDVLELFCGSGNFTGPLALRARSVAAVEAQGPALELARADAAAPGPAGAGAGRAVRFFAGDALPLALALGREGRRFGAVLLDPPRDGAKGIGPALRQLGAPRAVYVSCDPATLARDLKGCCQAGYRVEVVQAVDMFPQTHHVEGVALLARDSGGPGAASGSRR